jgi:hypothetical protein
LVIIEDIIWLERIVEKLAWKHNNKALIVTARGMNRNERKRYGRK